MRTLAGFAVVARQRVATKTAIPGSTVAVAAEIATVVVPRHVICLLCLSRSRRHARRVDEWVDRSECSPALKSDMSRLAQRVCSPQGIRWLSLLVTAAMLAAACSDDPGSTDPDPTARAAEVAASMSPTSTTTTTLRPRVPTDPPPRVPATIGDLEIPCAPSDAVALTDQSGVTDDAIVIGTGSDRGGHATVGAGVGVIEMIEVLADHCNAHGGILGRDILVREYDVAVVEARLRVAEACEETAALVGHAFLQLFAAELTASACGLPSYPNGPGLLRSNLVPLHGVLSALFLDPNNAAGVAVVGPDTLAGALDRERVVSAIAVGAPILKVVGNLAYSIALQTGTGSLLRRGRWGRGRSTSPVAVRRR
jgi:hypothetical protein